MDCLNKKENIRVILSGYSGRMGETVRSVVNESLDFSISAGVFSGNRKTDSFTEEGASILLFDSFKKINNVKSDVIIDFSSKNVLEGLLSFALKHKIPVVIGTTGHSKEQVKKIEDASDVIPIFFSGNMSIGVNLLIKCCKEVVKILKNNCDVEILEKHHNKKKDAPSGTAIMIADAISKELELCDEETDYVFDRTKNHEERKKNEIGISCVRAGTIVGEHSVIFGMDGETVTLTHTADSRKIFARGALLAAKFILKRSFGLYSMEDLCSEGLCFLK